MATRDEMLFGNSLRINADRINETYKSLITVSLEAFKYLSTISGGGAVALLAYAGSALRTNSPLPDIKTPVIWFLCALGISGLLLFLCYLAQLQLLNHLQEDKAVQNTKKTATYAKTLMICAVFWLVSFFCCARGLYTAAINLSDAGKFSLSPIVKPIEPPVAEKKAEELPVVMKEVKSNTKALRTVHKSKTGAK